MVKYLAMKTDMSDEIGSDLNELGLAAHNLATHVIYLAGGGGFISGILQWIATVAAIYLLVLDRTNWKTNILTTLLVPYLFLILPGLIFDLFRGEVGMWIAFVTVVLRLFFPKHFPDWLDMPASLILLLVVTPNAFSNIFRDSIYGILVCLIIGVYLLQEHIRASGGFKNTFTQSSGISNSIGILLLFVYPAWRCVTFFL
ncbi:cold-regulated 413 plasma membrane protein 1-like protein [Carex littledalei]|uniref:Cold-regulated 413 plasma membrane protein 1-like protein n=1 Tax=Carex littledalei TaxID=544730 RepID=A0A833QKY5_9POAL|nr:cold-regulated 413 plasma membrane protein 1-like protein [Carex littledalei]